MTMHETERAAYEVELSWNPHPHPSAEWMTYDLDVNDWHVAQTEAVMRALGPFLGYGDNDPVDDDALEEDNIREIAGRVVDTLILTGQLRYNPARVEAPA